MMTTVGLNIINVEFEDERFTSFMTEWGNDIEEFFPHFDEDDAAYGEILMLEIDSEIGGVFIYQHKGEELHIDVDYVAPKHRDIGVGRKFFQDKIEEFKAMGFSTVVALTDESRHREYLLSLGFSLSAVHKDRYEMELV